MGNATSLIAGWIGCNTVTPSSMKLQTSYVNGPLTPFGGIGAELKVAVAEAVAQEEPGRGAIGAHLVTLI